MDGGAPDARVAVAVDDGDDEPHRPDDREAGRLTADRRHRRRADRPALGLAPPAARSGQPDDDKDP
jgi:hypothetical protein